MALKDSEMQVVSVFGTAVLVGALFAPLVVFANAGAGSSKPENLVAIEASIAYSKTPQKQPQKKIVAPDVVKPEGVNRDENKKPDEKKDDKKPDKKPDLSDISKFHHNDDDDQVGKPTTDPGKFNGNENGYAEETKMTPRIRRRSRAGTSTPKPCGSGSSPGFQATGTTEMGTCSLTPWFAAAG